MLPTQEPKYDCTPAGRIVNRSTHKVVPDDEPLIIFRAKDPKALVGMRAYYEACDNPDQKAVIKSRIFDFEAFAQANPDLMKEPDPSLQDIARANLGPRPFGVDPALESRTR